MWEDEKPDNVCKMITKILFIHKFIFCQSSNRWINYSKYVLQLICIKARQVTSQTCSEEMCNLSKHQNLSFISYFHFHCDLWWMFTMLSLGYNVTGLPGYCFSPYLNYPQLLSFHQTSNMNLMTTKLLPRIGIMAKTTKIWSRLYIKRVDPLWQLNVYCSTDVNPSQTSSFTLGLYNYWLTFSENTIMLLHLGIQKCLSRLTNLPSWYLMVCSLYKHSHLAQRQIKTNTQGQK